MSYISGCHILGTYTIDLRSILINQKRSECVTLKCEMRDISHYLWDRSKQAWITLSDFLKVNLDRSEILPTKMCIILSANGPTVHCTRALSLNSSLNLVARIKPRHLKNKIASQDETRFGFSHSVFPQRFVRSRTPFRAAIRCSELNSWSAQSYSSISPSR